MIATISSSSFFARSPISALLVSVSWNLKIDPVVFNILPESVVRAECVLPIREAEGKIHVVLGRRPDYRDVIDKIQFVLDRTIVCAVADYERIAKAIDEIELANGAVRNGTLISMGGNDGKIRD